MPSNRHYRSSVSVEATPAEVLAYLSDPAHLASFVADAEPGASPEGDWFHVHEGRRPRVEWTAEPGNGWLEVDAEGAVASITAEVNVGTAGEDTVLDAALFALKDAIEGA